MKKLLVFFSVLILNLLVTSFLIRANENDIKKNLPKLLSNSTMGTDFFFSFIPGWESSSSDKYGLKVYVISEYNTNVRLTVDSKGFVSVKEVKANQIVEFDIPINIGQPYRKTDREPADHNEFWKGAAMHLTSDDPVVCYAISNLKYSADGFLIYPVHSLGYNYQVASYADQIDNVSQFAPSYTSIIAPYDKTNITFTMGGTDWSESTGGLLSGDSREYKLNRGDVLLIGSVGAHAELTGSKIESSNPVAVVSGHYCSYVPTNCGCCDMLEEMELPTSSWGTNYHVTPVKGRKKSPLIKIFAKEDNTKIFRDEKQIGFIKNAGGMEGSGYLHIRSNDNSIDPVLISGDKPINVVMFNPGQQDDNISSDPFQLSIIPVESYVKEAYFASPISAGTAENLLTLNYQTEYNGIMSKDMEIGIWNGTKYSWTKLNNYSSNPEIPFEPASIGKFSTKTISLPVGKIYKMRSSIPFTAYISPVNYMTSYGFQAFAGIKDLSKQDTIAPITEFKMTHSGNVNLDTARYVTDLPDDYSHRSNLSFIYMHNDVSYNYKFYIDDFKPCQDNTTAWRLEIEDNSKDAFAMLTFTDCAGNSLDTSILYTTPKTIMLENIKDYGLHSIGESLQHKFHIFNYSKTDYYELENIKLISENSGKYSGFTLLEENGLEPLYLPRIIPPLDTFSFIVQFDAVKPGEFWDSLGFGDCCDFRYISFLKAKVGTPIISVTDWAFPPTKIGSYSIGQFDIKNIGDVPLNIFDYKGPFLNNNDKSAKIYTSQELNDRTISSETPLILKPQSFITFEVSFSPDDTLTYPDSIFFISNSVRNIENPVDSVCVFNGKGYFVTSIDDVTLDKLHIYPNPVKDILYIDIQSLTSQNIDPLRIEIFDILGIKVAEKENFSIKDNYINPVKIPLQNLPNGLYNIVIKQTNKIISSNFIISK